MGDIRKLLDPKSIALIGASDVPGSLGRVILKNLLLAKGRQVFPVNLRKKRLLGIDAYTDVAKVPGQIDLAVILTPAPTVVSIVEECGKAGVEGAVVISSGFREIGEEGERREEELRGVLKRYPIRLIGPNCLGFIRPHLGLNVTALPANPPAGQIAFITQSGAFGRALIEWGIDKHLGLSMFASLGSMIDVELGDMIDFLGSDPHTRSIMVYMEEGVGDAKKFMSAARGFARNKPVVVLKPARRSNSGAQSKSHTGYLATSDKVYDAVLRRAGAVRVKTVADLFNTAGVLYSKHLPKGPRLLILTNAMGIGVMAANTLDEFGGKAAALGAGSIDRLKRLLPPFRVEGTPVDLLREADVRRYSEAIEICLEDEGVDGILVIFTPQGAARAHELAEALVRIAAKVEKPIIATFMGGRESQEGRDILSRNNIPNYYTPEAAVRTYLYMYSYERNLEILTETPADVRVDLGPPKNTLKALVRKVLAEGRTVLTEEESKRFLRDYRIPTVKTHMARNVEEAVSIGKTEGYPVVLKIVSPDVVYKTDAGGVVLSVSSETKLRDAYAKMMESVSAYCPGCVVKGVTVQKMVEKIDYEVILGAKTDPDFGSVILFGMGGTAVQIFQDFSIGLPPLNQALALKLMEETKVFRLLQGYRGRPAADIGLLERVILSFSNLVADFPEIAEMDINPLALLSDGTALALDARIVLDPDYSTEAPSHPHLIISPYPTRYITHWTMPDGTDVTLRPVRPEDEPAHHEMLTSLSENTLKERFFQVIRQITHDMHARMCNIDYDREMAIVAEVPEGDKKRIIGIGRLIIEYDFKTAEFAVLVHDDYQGRGLGYKLVDTIIGIGQEKGVKEIYGYVLSENVRMIRMCTLLGFTSEPSEEGVTKVSLRL